MINSPENLEKSFTKKGGLAFAAGLGADQSDRFLLALRRNGFRPLYRPAALPICNAFALALQHHFSLKLSNAAQDCEHEFACRGVGFHPQIQDSQPYRFGIQLLYGGHERSDLGFASVHQVKQ
jgi:hypothetical protein